MSKLIEIEFPATTEVFVLHNNKPVKTTIRAAQYSSTSESKGGKLIEAERISYSTQLAPNTALTSKQIGATEEELKLKLFGSSAADSGMPSEENN
jgi:hypothetical protein